MISKIIRYFLPTTVGAKEVGTPSLPERVGCLIPLAIDRWTRHLSGGIYFVKTFKRQW